MRWTTQATAAIVAVTFVTGIAFALSAVTWAAGSLEAAGFPRHTSLAMIFVGGIMLLTGIFTMVLNKTQSLEVEPDRWVYIVQFTDGDIFSFVPVVHKNPDLGLVPWRIVEYAERTMELQGLPDRVVETDPVIHGPFPIIMPGYTKNGPDD